MKRTMNGCIEKEDSKQSQKGMMEELGRRKTAERNAYLSIVLTIIMDKQIILINCIFSF